MSQTGMGGCDEQVDFLSLVSATLLASEERAPGTASLAASRAPFLGPIQLIKLNSLV